MYAWHGSHQKKIQQKRNPVHLCICCGNTASKQEWVLTCKPSYHGIPYRKLLFTDAFLHPIFPMMPKVVKEPINRASSKVIFESLFSFFFYIRSG